MQIVESFGKNIVIDGQQIGYISRDGLFINKHKFADITEDGEIYIEGKLVGYVDEDGYIFVKDKEAGYIDVNNNFVFYKVLGF